MPEVDPTKSASASTSGGALRMGQDLYVLVLLTVETKVGGRKAFVNFAVPPPENHVHLCLSGDVATQKLVGQENHSAALQRLDPGSPCWRAVPSARLFQ